MFKDTVYIVDRLTDNTSFDNQGFTKITKYSNLKCT